MGTIMNRFRAGILTALLGSTAVAQDVNVNTLQFQGTNSIIAKYQNRELTPGSMSANLRDLHHRILADPFPIPQEITGGSDFEIAIRMAKRYDIPAQLFFNLVTAESNWDAAITSNRGAIGLTQLMPGTADELGVNPWDSYENLEGGARYLRQQYDHFGTWELALAAYNAGPGAVRRFGGIPPYAETQEYVRKILVDVTL